jgi:hypothetical protein
MRKWSGSEVESAEGLEWRRLEMRAVEYSLSGPGDKLFPSSGGRHLSLFARAPPNIPSAFLAALAEPSSSRAAAFHLMHSTVIIPDYSTSVVRKL